MDGIPGPEANAPRRCLVRTCRRNAARQISPRRAVYFIKSGNVLGNTIRLTNSKLLVVCGLICSMVECYDPLLCKVSGPRGGLAKHEVLGASPQMAKSLEHILRSKE